MSSRHPLAVKCWQLRQMSNLRSSSQESDPIRCPPSVWKRLQMKRYGGYQLDKGKAHTKSNRVTLFTKWTFPLDFHVNPFLCVTASFKVADKPILMVSPQKLSFKEKLALHKKVADNSVELRPKSGNDAQHPRPYSTMAITDL